MIEDLDHALGGLRADGADIRGSAINDRVDLGNLIRCQAQLFLKPVPDAESHLLFALRDQETGLAS